MLTIRKANERGHADHGWLNSHHSFSFADYYDPEHMGFRTLRVINEDRVQPGRGFGTHPHRNMEIVTYVLDGGIRHKDSMGNGSVIVPGDVQRMTAGTGITHSEVNASESEQLHLLQIWLLPRSTGLTPSYEQKRFTHDDKLGRLRIVASPDGRDGSVTLNTDASIYAGILDHGQEATLTLASERHAWVQVASGQVRMNGTLLNAGDGAALSDEPTVTLEGVDHSEVILFDLP